MSKRPRSYSDSNLEKSDAPSKPRRSASQHVKGAQVHVVEEKAKTLPSDMPEEDRHEGSELDNLNEKTPLLRETKEINSSAESDSPYSKLHQAAKKLVAALTESLRWVLSTLALPIRKICRMLPKRNGRRSTAQAVGLSGSADPPEPAATSNAEIKSKRRKAQSKDLRRKPRSADSLAATSESEVDARDKMMSLGTPLDSRRRLQTSSSSEDMPQARRSMRTKLNNEETPRKRKQRKENTASTSSGQEPTLTVANIKSPTSPTSSLKLTKYPRAAAPPRPLIPMRQTSYSTSTTSPSSRLAQKTLVIDLDETLIHSLAKGGRMSSGHMVEVKLNATVGYGGAMIGPQHPILYYVHKRPHCDEFLRKVYKWYNLIVFTASVQEYADPVIDWLEQERKYFSARYYRQHCTFQNGAYIKDLSSVEPDLSKIMILDNSPLSYDFHEGNSIAISPLVAYTDPTQIMRFLSKDG